MPHIRIADADWETCKTVGDVVTLVENTQAGA